jgi:hypothetical protein
MMPVRSAGDQQPVGGGGGGRRARVDEGERNVGEREKKPHRGEKEPNDPGSPSARKKEKTGGVPIETKSSDKTNTQYHLIITN